ncbi:MAG TPA: hypothetical protein VD930_08045, partial [Gemmatimonadales bacterium]|nr:hypothetical protein [Gemmatimonadales bacterium]
MDSRLPDGVPAQSQGGTPSPLPDAQSADALETIEFAPVLELIAAHAVGLQGAARIRARRPTDDIGWIRGELDRVAEVAGLFRRGDHLLAEPIPDVSDALSRLRVQGSVLEGGELAALLVVFVSARRVHDDLRRVREAAPLAAELIRTLPDKGLER